MGRCISRSPALVASRRTSLVLPTAGHSVLRHVEVLYLLCSPSYPGRVSCFGRVTGILHNTGHHYSITGLLEAHVWLGGVILYPWPIFFFETMFLLCCTSGRYGYLWGGFEDGRWRQGVMFFCVCLVLLDFSSQWPGFLAFFPFSHQRYYFWPG